MKSISTLGPLLLLIFACRLCSMTGAHDYDPNKRGKATNLGRRKNNHVVQRLTTMPRHFEFR
jgi:hypothetical protein